MTVFILHSIQLQQYLEAANAELSIISVKDWHDSYSGISTNIPWNSGNSCQTEYAMANAEVAENKPHKNAVAEYNALHSFSLNK